MALALIWVSPLSLQHNGNDTAFSYEFKNRNRKCIVSASIDTKGESKQRPKGHFHGKNVSCDTIEEIGTSPRENRLKEVLEIMHAMDRQGVSIDSDTYASLLESCAKLKALAEGKEVHTSIINSRMKQNAYLWSKIVNMYAVCDNLVDARHVFDNMCKRNVFSWNAMIAGYTRHGLFEDCLRLYDQMQRSGVQPDKFTIPRVLRACAGLGDLLQGKEIHCHIIKRAFESDVLIQNALVDMYSKCGIIELARQVFDKMSERDLVSWNALIAGYSQNGHSREALKLYCQMDLAGLKPDCVSLASILPVCAYLGALQQGKEIHGYVIRNGFESNVFVGNALIDMYCKSGSIQAARHAFDKMFQKDVVSWNVLIAGYGLHGHGKNALALFYQMQQAGTKPDHITFLALLSTCSHAGFLDEGLRYFDTMSHDYGIAPGVEHYACMVDLLGRAGLVDKAYDFIKEMPFEPSATVWGALLGACSVHCNIEIGERAAERLFELEPQNPGNFVLLSNLYAAAGKWVDVAKVRRMMKDRGLKKRPGYSWIEVKKRVHTFCVGDKVQPKAGEIHAMLESLVGQMEEEGYVSDTTFELHESKEKEEEHILCPQCI